MYSDFSSLLDRISTQEELETLRQELQLIKQSLFQSKSGKLSSVLQSQVRAWVAEALEKALESSAQKSTQTELITRLEAELNHFETVQLELAFEPTQSMIEKLHSLLADHLKTPLVLKISYQPQVLGGATFAWQGKYADYSLRKKLEPALAEALESFSQNKKLPTLTTLKDHA